MNFYEIQLADYLLKAIEKQGFDKLTPIQERAIPLIRQGVDVIGKSKTGSGKTYAYAIPALEAVDLENSATQILIIGPTRELVSQECDEIRKLNEFREGCKVVPIFGGAHMDRQIQALKKGAKVVIGTPGRLCDHLRRKTLDLSEVKLVVLDEADEMFDMGFRNDIIKILEKTPEDRQTALFSATMPEEIVKLAENYMKNPVLVETETGNDSDFIDQYFVRVGVKSKNMAIRNLLDTLKPMRSIIFCNTKSMVDSLYESLEKNGYSICKLHGDIRQSDRKKTITAFKSGEIPVMIATDVAARGIDVNGLDVVFNYDVPETAEFYTHRIGRTGRAGKSGQSYTLINTEYQRAKFDEILKITDNTVLEYKCEFSIEKQEKTRTERREAYLIEAREKAQVKRGGGRKRFDKREGVKKDENSRNQSKSNKNNAQRKSSGIEGERRFIENYLSQRKKPNKDKGKPHGKNGKQKNKKRRS